MASGIWVWGLARVRQRFFPQIQDARTHPRYFSAKPSMGQAAELDERAQEYAQCGNQQPRRTVHEIEDSPTDEEGEQDKN